jgi:hypothetical protein
MGSSKAIVVMCDRRRTDNNYVSASDLARMAYCERQVAFDAQFGRRTSDVRRKAQERGLKAHEAFHLEGLARAASTDMGAFLPPVARVVCWVIVVTVVAAALLVLAGA